MNDMNALINDPIGPALEARLAEALASAVAAGFEVSRVKKFVIGTISGRPETPPPSPEAGEVVLASQVEEVIEVDGAAVARGFYVLGKRATPQGRSWSWSADHPAEERFNSPKAAGQGEVFVWREGDEEREPRSQSERLCQLVAKALRGG